MTTLALYNLVPLGVALVIGLVTGRWMLAGRGAAPPPDEPGESSPS